MFWYRDNGYLLPDRTVPCTSLTPAPVHGGNNTFADAPAEEQRCVVKLGWLWIDSASFRCVRRRPLSQARLTDKMQSLRELHVCGSASFDRHINGERSRPPYVRITTATPLSLRYFIL